MSRFAASATLAAALAFAGVFGTGTASAATCTPRQVATTWACVEGDCAWGEAGHVGWMTTTC